MRKNYYARLAWDNIRKNAKIYIPYFVTSVLTAAMLYMIRSLSTNPDFAKMPRGSRALPQIMYFGSIVTMIFAFIFLFYTNSFIVKRRRKEFGLLNILGMEKRHIAKMLLIETGYTIGITMVCGLGLGILLDKFMFLAITKLIGETAVLGFHVSAEALIVTSVFILGTFSLIYLNMLRQIHLAKPIELLSGSNVGEREPKTKLIMTILGIGLLGAGYILSIVTEDPLMVMQRLFIAIVCVIIGTYLLFTAVSIAVLKLLKKNKNYYYKTSHFTAVSGLLYRMKRNAVGLASVCILSTMVLVMVSSTVTMYTGMDKIADKRHPEDVRVTVYEQSMTDELISELEDNIDGITVKCDTEANLNFKGDRSAPEVLTEKDYRYNEETGGYETVGSYEDEFTVYITTGGSEGEEELIGCDIELADDECVVITFDEGFKPDSINMLGRTFKVAKTIFEVTKSELAARRYCILFGSREVVLEVLSDYNAQSFYENYCRDQISISYADGDKKSQEEKLTAILDSHNINGFYYTTKQDIIDENAGVFGGLLFLGIFLGTLFLMETIMIIYYKQITEGYEDQKRFEIMQNVGMSHSEVVKSIRSQILIVFFLPLLTAGMHVGFAFPLLNRLLKMLYLEDTKLFVTSIVLSFSAFAVLYSVIYTVTARTYYKIVRR